MQVTALRRYPVKSLAGSPEDALDVERWGPVGDRRWAVVDERGALITARERPELLTLRATALSDGGVRVEDASGESVLVPPPLNGRRIPTSVSRVPAARDAGDRAGRFLSAVLGEEARLVWQEDPRARSVNPANGGLPGEVLSLADAGPLLLTSERSLQRLQEWVGAQPQLSMWRFRPNVVIDGTDPFEEDSWRTVRLGETDCRVQQACDRCVMTTIDPATLGKGPEPLRTLARHRKWDGKTWFGIWLVPQGAGKVGVGDGVVPDPAAG